VQGGVGVGLRTGSGVAVLVAMTGVFPCRTGWVGVAALGGTKGVAGGGGAQAGDRKNVNRMASRLKCGLKRWEFMDSPIRNRDTTGRVPTGILFFFNRRGRVDLIGHIERHIDFTAQGLLPNEIFDLQRHFGGLSQEFLGILASLSETGVAV